MEKLGDITFGATVKYLDHGGQPPALFPKQVRPARIFENDNGYIMEVSYDSEDDYNIRHNTINFDNNFVWLVIAQTGKSAFALGCTNYVTGHSLKQKLVNKEGDLLVKVPFKFDNLVGDEVPATIKFKKYSSMTFVIDTITLNFPKELGVQWFERFKLYRLQTSTTHIITTKS